MNESFRILIVEDEHIVALDLQQQVQKLGHTVVGIGGTGQQAIDLAIETHPDLILMDIRLHGDIDGITAATEIRSIKPIPIVYLTAYTDTKTLERASITQPLGYILKPFQLRELETTIQLALYKSKVQAELNHYTRQLDSIMRYATDGFILVDSETNILRMNAKAESYLRLLKHDSNLPLKSFGAQSLSHLLNQSQPNVWEMQVPDSDHVFDVTVSEEFASSSSPENFEPDETARLFVIRDITLQKQMQKENEENAKMAAIGQLAAGIAHDFNNILGVILTKADLIKMTQPGLTDKTADYLSSIRHHVNRATNLITQVLDFTRSSQLDMNPLNVYTLVNELVKLMRRTFPTTIDIAFTNNSPDLWVKGDPTRISQAIMNLALRAREAMEDKGQLLISIASVNSTMLPESIENTSNLNNWIRICVEDTGRPINDSIVPYLFDPLVAPENDQRGLSMQLAQTQGIIEQHEGYIVVNTAPQKTVFSIFLPELLINQPEPETKRNTITDEEPNAKSAILLVEDDNSLRDAMAESLELMGYSVIQAVDGLDGLAKFKEHAAVFDIIFTDMIMPNMDGLELCREIRKLSSTVQFVILSGYSSHKFEELEDIEISAWLKKPIDIQQLDEILRTLTH